MNRDLAVKKLNENILKIKKFMFSKKFEKLEIYSRQYYRNIILNIYNNYPSLYSFIYGDFDKLNEINKTHGKDTGDLALSRALKIIKSSLPEEALISRIAGDEFSFILPNYSKNDCDNFKEIISKNLDTYRAYIAGLSITLGIEDSEKTPNASELEYITDNKVNTLKHRQENDTLIEPFYEDNDIKLDNHSSIPWKNLNQKIYSAVNNHIADLRLSKSFDYNTQDYKKEILYMIDEIGKSLENQSIQRKTTDSPSKYTSPIPHEHALLLHNLTFKKCTKEINNLSESNLIWLINSGNILSNLLIRNPLTHLYNKEYLNDFLFDNLLKSSSNYQTIFFSSSGVKISNTAYGHDYTDTKLKLSGELLKDELNSLVNFEDDNFTFNEISNFLVDLGGGNYITFINSSNSIKISEIESFINKNNLKNDTLKLTFSYVDEIPKKSKDELEFSIQSLQHEADLNKDKLKHNHLDCIDNKNAFVNEFQECISYYLENIPNAATDISTKQQFLKNIFEALLNETSKIKSEEGTFER